jgi:hypothetical protein
MTKKLTELTPAHLQSYPSYCPAVFVTDQGNYYIIGKRVDPNQVGLTERVMEGEELIEISSELIEGAIRNRHSKR